MQYGTGLPPNSPPSTFTPYCEAWPNLILGISWISPERKAYFYPNPTSRLLIFKNAPYSSQNKFSVYDASGTLVLMLKNVEEYQGIDVSSLPIGMYLAEMDYGTYKEKLKFVKE